MRKATPEDVERLVELMAEFYAEAAFSLNRQRASEAFMGLLSDDRLGHIWLIQANGQDVGHVVVTLGFSMEYGGAIAFLDDLFVRAAYRRAGLGAAALNEVREFCAKAGIRALHVETGPDNAAAQALYRRVGFVNTNRLFLAMPLAAATHEK